MSRPSGPARACQGLPSSGRRRQLEPALPGLAWPCRAAGPRVQRLSRPTSASRRRGGLDPWSPRSPWRRYFEQQSTWNGTGGHIQYKEQSRRGVAVGGRSTPPLHCTPLSALAQGARGGSRVLPAHRRGREVIPVPVPAGRALRSARLCRPSLFPGCGVSHYPVSAGPTGSSNIDAPPPAAWRGGRASLRRRACGRRTTRR